MAVTQGTWNWLPFNLGSLDFGLTEKYAPSLGQNPNQSQSIGNTQNTQKTVDTYNNSSNSTLFNQNQTSYPYQSTANQNFGNTNQNANNSGSSGGSSSGGQPAPNPYETYIDGRKLIDIQQEEARRQQAIRDNISNGFNSIYSTLDSMSNLIPQQQQESYDFLNQKYDYQKQALDAAKTGAITGLDQSKQQVANRAAQSSADVATNLRNMLKASAMQLGASGAGNSSATDIMAPYAYSKLASQNTASINKQANDQYLDIDKKTTDVKTTYDTQIASLGTWLTDAQTQVKQYYMDKLDQIKQAKMTADQNKMQALNSLESGLLAQAQNQLSVIDNRAAQYAQSIQQWAQDRLSQLDNYKLQITNSGSFNPQDILWNEMSALGLNNTQGGNTYSNLGVSYGKKKDQYGNYVS